MKNLQPKLSSFKKDIYRRKLNAKPRHIQSIDGKKIILIDQMTPKTKFIWDNFPQNLEDDFSEGTN